MTISADVLDGRANVYRWDVGTLDWMRWDGTLSVGAVTIGTVDQGVGGASAWKVDGSAVTQPVSGTVAVTSATLATTAKQDTGNTSNASIDTKTPALGQALAAASTPVVLTAAQLSTLTPLATVTANQGGTWTVGVSGVVGTSYVVRLDEASATITYVGLAVPGTATSAASWSIKRLDSTAGLIVLWGAGTAAFTQVWDNRAALAYS